MDYNTQREKLILSEYGRYVQEMVKDAKKIPDKSKRTQQVKAIVNAMGILNPQVKEGANQRHKLWDHVHVIADYDLDIDDAPFPVPERTQRMVRPHEIKVNRKLAIYRHYGRNIQNIAMAIAAKPDNEERRQMVLSLANYMRKQYLIWNKDTVTDQTIFDDITTLSGGVLTVPEGTKLSQLTEVLRQPNQPMPKVTGNVNGNKQKKKKKSQNYGR